MGVRECEQTCGKISPVNMSKRESVYMHERDNVIERARKFASGKVTQLHCMRIEIISINPE